MKPSRLTAEDKKLFAEFLRLENHELAVYAWENIYIWKGLFDIRYQIIQDSLCIFFRDKLGCFLYLPPLSRRLKPRAVEEAFSVMDALNSNKRASRIENVEAKNLEFYRSLGYRQDFKFFDYLCLRQDLAELKGNRFKSKRACCNYFIKNYDFRYLPYSEEDKKACLDLYGSWMKQRSGINQDRVYTGMLEDSFTCLKGLLKDYRHLRCSGRIVKVEGKVRAFTFGFRLNPETFCILYEVTDLTLKGLAQFIFTAFCRELQAYKYINIMDDSGLENLSKVKLSYRPVKLVRSYVIGRPR